MPEYLAPGVYVEETSYRARAIEGVSTSTAGFVGQCRSGPVEGRPQLVTSMEEWQRRFGSIKNLRFGTEQSTNFLAHAVRYFFENGGKRAYIARVFRADSGAAGVARSRDDLVGTRFAARYPGYAGELKIEAQARRSGNVKAGNGAAATLNSVRPGDMVEVSPVRLSTIAGSDSGRDPVDPTRVGWVTENADGQIDLDVPSGAAAPDWRDAQWVQRVSLTVVVYGDERTDTYRDLSTHPDSSRSIFTELREENPPDQDTRVILDSSGFTEDRALELLARLANEPIPRLEGGSDGLRATAVEFQGDGTGNEATGLASLDEIEDIAIVAAPGGSVLGNPTEEQAVRDALIGHCERNGYRVAILSAPRNASLDEVRDIRGQHDSTYAALYYPWVLVRDPTADRRGTTLSLPPEGFVAGIWARSDAERGVYKAPANEVVRGALGFGRPISQGVQEVLNPEGINCLRTLEGRGNRVWGARTISSDPEWIYLNVRRLLIFLERSIDRSTQWVVFEPNNEDLWLKVTLTVELFLEQIWLSGALLGRTADKAFFVRCDRTTMTQSDLDNGRLICLVGVAPTKPAEFVVFRIGQWTAEASIL